jgi:hypothetical protein
VVLHLIGCPPAPIPPFLPSPSPCTCSSTHAQSSATIWQSPCQCLEHAAALQESLNSVSGLLAQYGSTRTLTESSQEVFTSACKAFAITLCPYVASCFDQLYPHGSMGMDLKAVVAPLAAER